MTSTYLVKQEHIHPPVKLNESMIEALSLIISKGNYYITAAKQCGIHETTLSRWISKGEEDIIAGETGTLHAKLCFSLKEAEGKSEAELVERIRNAGSNPNNYIANAILLERRFPERWAKRDRTTIDIHETKDIQITHVEVCRPQIEASST